MLQFLESGSAIYPLLAVCILGIACRVGIKNLYKRLTKEIANMTLTKNKRLKALKQNAECTYRMNQGIANTKVFVEHQLQELRAGGFALSSWGDFSNQLTFLCFLLGGACAFGAYWYRCDSYYIVLYGTAGILLGLLSMTAEQGSNINEKKQQLSIALQDYLENYLFGKAMREPIREILRERPQETAELEQIRENVRSGSREEGRSQARTHASIKRPERKVNKESAKLLTQETAVLQESTNRKGVDYLKRSLEQIAVSREKNKTEANWVKDLNPEEIQLIGDIIKEYLS